MFQNTCSILSIAPYRILPPTSGGHLGIVYIHHYLGKLCQDNVASTDDNDREHQYAFQMHPVFPSSPKRYLPLYQYQALKSLAKRYDATAIYCDHPYMAITAMALSQQLKIPWFLRSHNIESERFRTFGKKWWPIVAALEKFVMRKANGIFFVTPEDEQWAIKNFGLKEAKCHFIPYGTILPAAPTGHEEAKNAMATQLNIDAGKPWLYFLGALDYYPNTQAVSFILNEVLPRLNKKQVAYEVLIAGKGMPEDLKEQIANTDHIHYMGFIPDLDIFLKSCDIMLNPVILGGGIKTKAVEALGYNKFVISTHSGAAGLPTAICAPNLLISKDYDWDTFVTNIIHTMGSQPEIEEIFYKNYYWGNIAQNILNIMQTTNS